MSNIKLQMMTSVSIIQSIWYTKIKNLKIIIRLIGMYLYIVGAIPKPRISKMTTFQETVKTI